jgi:hypothetical protein
MTLLRDWDQWLRTMHSGDTLSDRHGARIEFAHGTHRKLARPGEPGFGFDLAMRGGVKPFLKEPENYMLTCIQVGL